MHLLAVLEYDGTDFLGFQSQKLGRTVQDELEKALAEFSGERIRVVGGGRTDTGVHALGQTASFTIDWQRDLDTLQRALNAKLPRDLAVKSLREVPKDFSARYSAQSRMYRYTVLNTRTRSPLQERYALWIDTPLELETMQYAAGQLVGRRDFGAFGSPPHGDNTVRRMIRADVKRAGDYVWFEFQADAFLYRMVRRLVGTLLKVGRGKLGIKEFRELLEARGGKTKLRSGDAVSPHGLTLVEIEYDFGTENRGFPSHTTARQKTSIPR